MASIDDWMWDLDDGLSIDPVLGAHLDAALASEGRDSTAGGFWLFPDGADLTTQILAELESSTAATARVGPAIEDMPRQSDRRAPSAAQAGSAAGTAHTPPANPQTLPQRRGEASVLRTTSPIAPVAAVSAGQTAVPPAVGVSATVQSQHASTAGVVASLPAAYSPPSNVRPREVIMGSTGGAQPAPRAVPHTDARAAPTKRRASGKARRRRVRAPGVSTVYERRRRARVANLIDQLSELLFPTDAVDGVDDGGPTSPTAGGAGSDDLAGGAGAGNPRPTKRKRMRPSKTAVLQAAVTAVTKMKSQAIQRPLPGSAPCLKLGSTSKPGVFPRDRNSMLALGHALAQDLLREYTSPAKLETVALVHECVSMQYAQRAGTRNPLALSDAQPGLAHSHGLTGVTAFHVDVCARVFRLMLPSCMTICERHGVYNYFSYPEFVAFVRQNHELQSWRALQTRARVRWLAPHLSEPIAVQDVPAHKLRVVLQGMWDHMLSPAFAHALPKVLSGARDAVDTFVRVAPLVVPLWEAMAVALGFERSLEGMARFVLSASKCTDELCVELLWRVFFGVSEVCQYWLMPIVVDKLRAGDFSRLRDDGIDKLFSDTRHFGGGGSLYNAVGTARVSNVSADTINECLKLADAPPAT